MPKSLKIASAIAALLVIVAVAVLLFVRANISKAMIENAASEALGMEVRVGGRLTTGIFPTLHVTLQDVRIRNRGTEIGTTREAQVWIDFLPLFRKEVRIGKIALSHARISIERNLDGKFNFERPEATAVALPALDLASVSVSDGTLRYANKQSGDIFEARHCSLDVDRLRLLRGEGSDFMKHVSITADLACGEFQRNDLMVSDLKFSADGRNGVIHLKPVTMHLYGA